GQAGAARADVRRDGRRAARAARRAGRARRDARRDGEHGRVLEARVLRAGERLHLSARECRAYQAGPGAENRRQGLGLDRAAPGAWAAAGPLRADYLDEAIAPLSVEIERVMAPWAEPLRRLDTIPGINQRTAEVILAEIGPDRRVFPSARPLASWAALCPGHHESGGQHKSRKNRKGHRWPRAELTE